MFRIIDVDSWERKNTFNHFITADCCYNITQNICITNFYNFIKQHEFRFFPSFTWAVLKAVNSRPEFRMAYDKDNNLGYFDIVNPEYTVLNPKTKNMDSLNTQYNDKFSTFYDNMVHDIYNFNNHGIHTASRENSVLVSCVPWISYANITVQMKANTFFLRPMIIWGKYTIENNEVIMPFTVQVHHAVADGYHCYLFFEDLKNIVNIPEKYLL